MCIFIIIIIKKILTENWALHANSKGLAWMCIFN